MQGVVAFSRLKSILPSLELSLVEGKHRLPTRADASDTVGHLRQNWTHVFVCELVQRSLGIPLKP